MLCSPSQPPCSRFMPQNVHHSVLTLPLKSAWQSPAAFNTRAELRHFRLFILISKSSSFLTLRIHPSGCEGHQISQTHAGGWETPLETEGDPVDTVCGDLPNPSRVPLPSGSLLTHTHTHSQSNLSYSRSLNDFVLSFILTSWATLKFL